MKVFALAGAVILVGSAVIADDADLISNARKCTAIEGAGLRMTCYDAVFRGDGRAIIPETAMPKGPTKMPGESDVDDVPVAPLAENRWVVTRDKSAMTDQETVILSLQSEEMVQCRQYGSPSHITLVARCMEDRTSIFITGDCHVASGFEGYGEVTLRLDDGTPFKRSMDASTDNSALGLWNGGSAIGLLTQMIGKERLIARFTPFSSNSVEPSFKINGFEEAVKPLRAACGW